jgi:hypothetical protein
MTTTAQHMPVQSVTGGAVYVVKYRPLCSTAQGRTAVSRDRLPPYIDGSCRREPDLQSQYPSISCLCRGGQFAPKLVPGDRVVYIASKHSRLNLANQRVRAVVAILRIKKPFNNHQQAADWYSGEGLPLPSNCMVTGNAPEALDRTTGLSGCACGADELDEWDRKYRARARKHRQFFACDTERLNLYSPPVLDDDEFVGRFDSGKLRRRAPFKIEQSSLEALYALKS